MQAMLVENLLAVLAAMTCLWLASLVRRDASIVDPFWGLGFVLVASLTLWRREADGARSWLLWTLISLWGWRLSGYLAWRNWRHGEDPRYAKMRQANPDQFWWRSWLTVFVLQAVLLWWVSLPLQVAIRPDSIRLGFVDGLGVALWCVGFAFETIGDYQLARFKSAPQSRGRVLDRGLWRYTRHPNYFGDFCIWWGVFLISLGGGAAWTLGSPLLMSVLLLYVSGVRMTEQAMQVRGPAYADYQRRTNRFFPGPPRPE